ncbi:uroporphyrinogen decarboxylase (URO-D) [Oxobacter pfennigii]|uniref:Uroporphyrinogen decarboxylase (URO-D) n=1 Tax=Oxobacter pfennigii TaxID=36849 RepID=A0A0P9AEU8_9CLOT|nr:uroporphyrinogen decarboxylase family protein [Oxobacter pfennigii]KPU43845.1 uroporphyrinogen decarboxylase (URO-D) [Oxobacter pfennigii]
MNGQGLLKERIQLFNDAAQMKKTARIPQVANFFTWKILDSEYKLSEALLDYDKMFRLVCDFHERYGFDAYMDLGTRNPVKVTNSLGGYHYMVDDEREVMNIDDQVYMEADEYGELAEDPIKFIWTKIMPRKYKKLNEEGALEVFKNTTQEFLAFSEYNRKINEKFLADYEAPAIFNIQGGVLFHPFEMLFNYYRGIKGLSIDIRRNKERVMEAVEALYNMFTKPAIDGLDGPKSQTSAFDAMSAFLAHSILSPKQFGEIYWPILKKIIDKLVETGKTMYIFSENTMLQYYEYLQEVPKGHLVIHVELDDVFEFRKKLPNICIAGGMPADLLGNSDPQTCIDYAKKLVDELGRDGGYIFSQNKMMSFRYDCKRENLLAVTDFVRDYRG